MAEQLSPMMQHYISVKEKYPGTILLYRLGDFYEMFFEDAKLASSILELTLTGRSAGLTERVPMCGVPYHAVDSYISKLISAGYKVAICEQLTDPKLKSGMVERDVIRVITPGTVTEDGMLDNKKNNYISSVILAKEGYGVSWLDLSTGEFNTVQEITDSPFNSIEDLLSTISPTEIICNGLFFENRDKLISVIQSKLPSPEKYYDWAFDYDIAERLLCNQFNIKSIDVFFSKDLTLAISCAGALMDYINNTQKTSLVHINCLKYFSTDSVMLIDLNTRRNLELLETMADKSKKGSLLWVLDKTQTNMGARNLRHWLTEPLTSELKINERLNAVSELIENTDARNELKIALSKVKDIERLCSKISYRSVNPRECLAILDSLNQIPSVKKALLNSRSKLLKSITSGLNSMEKTAELLDKAIAENPQDKLAFGDYIKVGYNKDLDELRDAENIGKRWLIAYEAKERDATGIKNLKVGYNRVFGYYIELSNSFVKQAPYNYVRKQTLTTGERFITEELKQMEEKLLSSSEQAVKLEQELYSEIKEYLLKEILKLQNNAKLLAELDTLVSFATVSIDNNYVKPIINSKIKNIKIENGRHPVIETLLKANQFISNDTLIDNKDNLALVITGPNMAGKSTYMRQVALIVLLAHIGCFVPAKSAEISLTDRIFTRVGASDNLSVGQSTFMVEMIEVAQILNSATDKSLLILDEIGRGTSTIDGLSIAWATLEYIVKNIRAKTLFATHYHELSELEGLYPGIKNYRVLIKELENSIVFLYKIARGGANKSFGIEVASLAGVKQEVIGRAKELMQMISERAVNQNIGEMLSQNISDKANISQQMTFLEDDNNKRVISILKDISIEKITPIEALTILNDLKKTVNNG